jgi:hypothetical protein
MILSGTGRGAAREARGEGGVPHPIRPEATLACKQRRSMSYPRMLLWQRSEGAPRLAPSTMFRMVPLPGPGRIRSRS